jgi:hypothetical protein
MQILLLKKIIFQKILQSKIENIFVKKKKKKKFFSAFTYPTLVIVVIAQ